MRLSHNADTPVHSLERASDGSQCNAKHSQSAHARKARVETHALSISPYSGSVVAAQRPPARLPVQDQGQRETDRACDQQGTERLFGERRRPPPCCRRGKYRCLYRVLPWRNHSLYRQCRARHLSPGRTNSARFLRPPARVPTPRLMRRPVARPDAPSIFPAASFAAPVIRSLSIVMFSGGDGPTTVWSAVGSVSALQNAS